MSVHQLPLSGHPQRGTIFVWGDPVEGFSVTQSSVSGESWSGVTIYETGEAAISAAYLLNRDAYGGRCVVNVSDEAMAHANPGVGFVSLPGDF